MGSSAISTEDTSLPKGTTESKKEDDTTDEEEKKSTSTDAKVDYDLDKVEVEKLPPEIQSIVKGFQADYTKKTTKIAEDAKIHAANTSWYDENEVLINEFNSWKQNQTSKKTEEDDVPLDDEEDFTRALKKESKEIRERYDDLFSSGFGTLVDCMKLQKENPDFDIDIKKVLTYAEKENITDVNKAFQGAYGEDIFNKRLNDEVSKKEAELKEKYETNVMNTNFPIGRTQLKIRKPKDRT